MSMYGVATRPGRGMSIDEETQMFHGKTEPRVAAAAANAANTTPARLIALAAVVVTTAATVLAVLVGNGPAAAAAGCAMRGHAFASAVHVGGRAQSQRSANVGLCTRRVGVTRLNRTAHATVPKVLQLGTVTSRVVTRHKLPGPAHRITAQTHTGRVVLLGAIHARAVMARATASTRRRHRLVGRTTILGLTLQGKNVPEHPKVDQTYALPGLGKIVLNHQTRVRHGNRITITVTALSLELGKGNPLGQKPATITIGHTTASVQLPAAG